VKTFRLQPTRPTLSLAERLLAVAITAVIAWRLAYHTTGFEDFGQLWTAARSARAGLDPYLAVSAMREYRTWGLLYPGTAIVAILPFSFASLLTDRTLFTVLGAMVFAFLATRDGWGRAPWVVHFGFLQACDLGQWSTWLAVAVMCPWLGGLAVCKPNIGLAVIAAIRSRRGLITAAIGGVALLVASLVWMPEWPRRWLATLPHGADNLPLIIGPGGPVLALVLLRWRRWETRFFLMMACVPQNPLPFGVITLAAIPFTFGESALLAVLSYAIVPIGYVPTFATFHDFANVARVVTIWFAYVPMLLMLLRRPNEGDIPQWLENVAQRLPKWLRGTPRSAHQPALGA
jgi:hypothetical protein